MTVHSQLKLRRVPAITLPNLRLPRAPEAAFAPMYVQAALVALVALAVVTSGLLLVVRLLTPATPPFTAYEMLFPGAPKQIALEQGFDCLPGYNTEMAEFCSRHPSSGLFVHIGVWVADDVIQRITFTFRDGVFRVGDLPWARDGHMMRTRLGNYRLSFEAAGLKAVARSESGDFSLFLPIQWVTLAAQS